MATTSSRMTKDELREALADVGVKTQARLKKAELVKLYRQHVLDQANVSTISPNDSLIGGFSSDEDEPVVALDTSHINDNTNVADLTSDEIFFKLRDLGESVGPVTPSTRSIYERKLIKLLGQEVLDGGDAIDNGGHVDKADKLADVSAFSDDDQEDDVNRSDETDEYDVGHGAGGDNKKKDGKLLFGGTDVDESNGFVKSTRSFHDKTEERPDGSVVRTRRTHTLKTFNSENLGGAQGKTFVPPPPIKRNITPIIVAVFALVVCVALAAAFWVNLQGGQQQFAPVPSVPVASTISGGAVPSAAKAAAGAAGGR